MTPCADGQSSAIALYILFASESPNKTKQKSLSLLPSWMNFILFFFLPILVNICSAADLNESKGTEGLKSHTSVALIYSHSLIDTCYYIKLSLLNVKMKFELGMVMNACNSSSQEAKGLAWALYLDLVSRGKRNYIWISIC